MRPSHAIKNEPAASSPSASPAATYTTMAGPRDQEMSDVVCVSDSDVETIASSSPGSPARFHCSPSRASTERTVAADIFLAKTPPTPAHQLSQVSTPSWGDRESQSTVACEASNAVSRSTGRPAQGSEAASVSCETAVTCRVRNGCTLAGGQGSCRGQQSMRHRLSTAPF